MVADRGLLPRPVTNKTPSQIASEWDSIAHLRSKQIVDGVDVSFNYILKPTILSLLREVELSRVLDLGCGTGELTKEIGLLSGNIIGVDSSNVSIRIAEQTVTAISNLSYQKGSAEEFARCWDGPHFTTVVANMTLMACLDLDSFLQAVAELVTPRGHFVATLTHPCFWPMYWGYADADWFDYHSEVVIEAPFRISAEATNVVTTHVHRPMSAYLFSLERWGFTIERLIEPFPNEDVQRKYAEQWGFPRFLAFRAVFDPR